MAYPCKDFRCLPYPRGFCIGMRPMLGFCNTGYEGMCQGRGVAWRARHLWRPARIRPRSDAGALSRSSRLIVAEGEELPRQRRATSPERDHYELNLLC